MTRFFAILRDSYYEAVDGYVIYVMLVLSVFLLLIFASLSFTPEPAEAELPKLLSRFVLYIPERGQAKVVGNTQGVDFAASEIETEGADVRFRLTVSGANESFRKAVAGWKKPAEHTMKLKLPQPPKPGETEFTTKDLEFALPIPVSEEEARAVTETDKIAFLQNQFAVHLGVRNVEVTAIPGPVDEKKQQFEVRLPGARSSRAWPQQLSIFFGSINIGQVPLGPTLYIVQDQIVNGLGAGISLIVAVIITAFFIPNMIRKGSLDLLISKPIGRSQLLIYKYFGGLTFIFLLSVVNFGGSWLVLGIRSGHWDPAFLLAIPMLTFTFALLYSISTCVAVFTRSAIAAIILTLGFAFVLYVVGQAKTLADQIRALEKPPFQWPEWAYTGIDTLNQILPRYKDLDKLMGQVTAEGTLTLVERRFMDAATTVPGWGETVGLSLGYIVLFLSLACWRLSTRDG